MKRIVVVGASLAGLRAAEKLRADGYAGYLALVGAERQLPYQRPPLSKQVLTGTAEPESVRLRDEAGCAELDLDLLLGKIAAGLDVAGRKVSLDSGEVLDFDGLLIATGSIPRSLPGIGNLPGVHTLRTLEDALAIRDAMAGGARVVIAGAGFIGAEVAAAARSWGLDVTVAEPLAVPLQRVLGARMGERAAALMRDHGVSLRCGVGVAGLDGGIRVEQVRLTDGTALPADLVVVGVGARPATDWLEASGLPLQDGLLCDQACAVSGTEGIYAAGDAARWHHPLYGATRVEHWTNAVEQGTAAAANMLRGPASAQPFGPVPYVWSDQFGTKIQFVGVSDGADEIRLVPGASAEYRFAACYGQHGQLVGCLGFAQPRAVMQARRMIAEGLSLAAAVDALS